MHYCSYLERPLECLFLQMRVWFTFEIMVKHKLKKTTLEFSYFWNLWYRILFSFSFQSKVRERNADIDDKTVPLLLKMASHKIVHDSLNRLSLKRFYHNGVNVFLNSYLYFSDLRKTHLQKMSFPWKYPLYSRHYNLWFVYFLPTFWSPKAFFQGAFFLKFWPYVWIVFKSGF